MCDVINPINLTDMQLGRNLKKLMLEHDLKTSQLSRSTKIPFQTLHNWLVNQKPRDIDQVKKVAEYFKISLDSLLYGPTTEKHETLEEYKDEINAGIFEVILRRTKK